ncbi:MAG: phage major capsid protein [Candidatus Thorarchaeota archaeon]
MTDLEKTMEGFNASIEALSTKIDEATGRFEKNAEDLTYVKETVNKALITETEKPINAYKGYGYGNAQVGKTNWTPEQKKGFLDYVKMVKDNDGEAITKAFGDNPFTATTTAGGYLVPDEFRAELVRLAYQKSLALQKCRIVPMANLKLYMPSVASGFTATWGAINTQILDQLLTLGQVELSAEKMVSLSLVPVELLSSSAISVADLIANEMAEAFAKKIDEEVFDGNSSDSSNHKFDGLGYATGVQEEVGAVDGTPTLAELITEDNLIAMVANLAGSSALDGAEWYWHPTAWNVIRGLEDGASSKILRLNENYKYDLLGFPVNLSNQVPVAATAELPVGFFGNLANVYIGDKMDFSLAVSTDERFSSDQAVFKGTQHIAVNVALPAAFSRIVFGAAS